MAYRRMTQKGIADSWRAQSWAIRVLRAWLSFTWIYAGWDKATDPGYLTKGETGFIVAVALKLGVVPVTTS